MLEAAPVERSTIAVVGPGRMGVGIAQALALAGHRVLVVDVKDRSADDSRRALAEAERQILAGFSLLASIGFLDDTGRDAARRLVAYRDVASAEEALSGADTIFEAVPELLDVKAAAYERIGATASQGALIASTTSTIQVDALAACVPDPSRFMNTHWLNPPTLIPLVEVMPSAATGEDALAAMTALLEEAGKVPVRCGPSPGYIVPRIQAVAMNEAARLVEEGVADAVSVDTACRLGFGVRFATMGLLEFVDWGGSDILLHATSYLADALASERYAPPGIVADKVESGALGLKSGSGFHDLAERDLEEYQRETLRRLVGLLEHLGVLQRPRLNGTVPDTRARESAQYDPEPDRQPPRPASG